MTSRSERDKILDEVIAITNDMQDWKDDDEFTPEEACIWVTCLYHVRKAVYMTMDDPEDNLL